MPTKIIVSYDGTANEDDAHWPSVACSARAGAEVSLQPARAPRPGGRPRPRRTLAQNEAEERPRARRGAVRRQRGRRPPRGHRPLHARRDCAALAQREDARRGGLLLGLPHTANGHIAVGNSSPAAARGRPRGGGDRARGPGRHAFEDSNVQKIVAVGDASDERRARRRPRRSPPRSARRSRRWPTSRPTCWCSTRAGGRARPRRGSARFRGASRRGSPLCLGRLVDAARRRSACSSRRGAPPPTA